MFSQQLLAVFFWFFLHVLFIISRENNSNSFCELSSSTKQEICMWVVQVEHRWSNMQNLICVSLFPLGHTTQSLNLHSGNTFLFHFISPAASDLRHLTRSEHLVKVSSGSSGSGETGERSGLPRYPRLLWNYVECLLFYPLLSFIRRTIPPSHPDSTSLSNRRGFPCNSVAHVATWQKEEGEKKEELISGPGAECCS